MTKRPIPVCADRGCGFWSEPWFRGLAAERIDVSSSSRVFDGGCVLLVGAAGQGRAASSGAVAELRRRNPLAVVYMLARAGEVEPGMLAQCARSGVDRVFTIGGRGDVADFVGVLSARLQAPLPERELLALADLELSGLTGALVEHALRNAWRDLSLSEIALHFGRSARTLGEQLQEAHLPCLRDLVRCGRYLHVAELRRLGVCSAREQARLAGFGSATEMRQWQWRLRNAIRREPRLHAFAFRFPSLRLLVGE